MQHECVCYVNTNVFCMQNQIQHTKHWLYNCKVKNHGVRETCFTVAFYDQNSTFSVNFVTPLKCFTLHPTCSFIVYFLICYPFTLYFCLLPSPHHVSYRMKNSVSASLFQSHSAADPSSEQDYPSISISHTLISHVPL